MVWNICLNAVHMDIDRRSVYWHSSTSKAAATVPKVVICPLPQTQRPPLSPPALRLAHSLAPPSSSSALSVKSWRPSERHERGSAQWIPGRLGAAAGGRERPEAESPAGRGAVRRLHLLWKVPCQVSAGQRLRRGALSEGTKHLWKLMEYYSYLVKVCKSVTLLAVSDEVEPKQPSALIRGTFTVLDYLRFVLDHCTCSENKHTLCVVLLSVLNWFK